MLYLPVPHGYADIPRHQWQFLVYSFMPYIVLRTGDVSTPTKHTSVCAAYWNQVSPSVDLFVGTVLYALLLLQWNVIFHEFPSSL